MGTEYVQENGNRLRLEHFLAPVLLVLLFAYAYFSVFIDVSPLFFWALWAMITCVAVLGVLRSRSYTEQFLILTIVLMGIVVVKNPASFWPFQIRGVDDYFELGLARTIMETGRWNPEAGLGYATNYYGYFPGVHLLLAALSLVTGLDPFRVGKFVYLPALILVLFAFAYSVTRLCCRRVADSGFVGIAMLFYVSALGMLAALAVARRTYADVFVIMIFYVLARQSVDGKKASTTPVLLLSAAGLAIGHHFPQYYMLIIGSVFVLFLWRSKLSFGSAARWFLIIFSLDTGWELFVAPGVMGYDIRGYLSSLLNFLGGLMGVGIGAYGKPTTVGYSLPERLFPYASQSALILLCMIGLIILLSKRNIRLEIMESPSFAVLKFVTVFGLLVYVVTGPLIITEYFFFPFSTSDFSTIGLSILLCIGLLRLFKKARGRESGSSSEDPPWSMSRTFGAGATLVRRRVLVIVLLLLVMSSGNLLIAFSARVLDRTASQVTILEDVRNFSHEDLSAGVWLGSHLGTNTSNGISGDYITWLVFTGYLSLDSSYDYSIFNNTQSFVQYGQNYIVVVDSRLAVYTSDEDPSLFPSPTVNQLNFVAINRLCSNGLLSVVVIGPR